jgi:hypothetical protein
MFKQLELKEKNKLNINLWVYPMLFGLLGGFLGLFLRYVYTGGISVFVLKNLLHSHSHVMLLGFVFNAFIAMLWGQFSRGIDKRSIIIFWALQICVAVLLIGFVLQGYAVFTIVFSTLHLWLSYYLLIRLWNRLEGNREIINFVKIGIVFHFIASLGPYALGPLKVFGYEHSPWYQQSIYFYLHFQYFGSFFMWLLAAFFNQAKIWLSKEQVFVIVLSVILLFAHSLDYSFDHWAINLLGGLGSVLLFGILFSLRGDLVLLKKQYRIFYFVLVVVLFINCLGSLPIVSELVVQNRFLLIAWLHLLFLGVYLPFLWLESPLKINKWIWQVYIGFVSITEMFLVFPNEIADFLSVSTMMLLFISYLGVVFCICVVHLSFLLKTVKNELTRTR